MCELSSKTAAKLHFIWDLPQYFSQQSLISRSSCDLIFYSSAGDSLTSALSASVSANSASDAETEGSSRS
jgi:hypothetical protein